MQIERVKIGEIGVDSGQLIICDPCYIGDYWKETEDKGEADFAHAVYQHTKTGSLWQYTYGKKPQEGVNMIPGTYQSTIPEFGKSANDLIKSGEFIKSNINARPHIADNEFSYRGICNKMSDNLFTQMNFGIDNPGLAVISSTGFGDGTYEVYAEIADCGAWGKRVKRVTIELIEDSQLNNG